MLPLIRSNQPVTLEPLGDRVLNIGDIVFVKCKGKYFTHLIGAIRGGDYLIQNNRGHKNGWVKRKNIYGIVTKIWDK